MKYHVHPIHPFAARMAPEIAFDALKGVKKGALILDPMVGSGMVVRTVAAQGYNGIGVDIDPLAVLMSKAWTSPCNPEKFILLASTITGYAQSLSLRDIDLPWIDEDPETEKFIRFWFADKQINALRKLSYLIHHYSGPYSSMLKIAMSRLIITKTNGASLAADVSHSRPHRVKQINDFDVFSAYEKSCFRLVDLMSRQKQTGKVHVRLGDARKLTHIENESVASVITSPPYLNALDYMRGHKLALVWLGHRIGSLGKIRSISVGAERAPDQQPEEYLLRSLLKGTGSKIEMLPPAKQQMVNRYATDMYLIMREIHRVLERGAKATLVVGNSCLKEILVENSRIIRNSGCMAGLKFIQSRERTIPVNKRYLPYPDFNPDQALSKRMRTESVITFKKIS